jgi:hypothetical protein
MQAAGNILEAAQRIGRFRGRDARELVGAWRDRLAGTDAKRRRLRKWTLRGGPPLLIALAIGGYVLLRPVPQPDYRRDSLRKVFNYTLLTDEFNRLPVERRMELIGQLVQRLKGMSAGDSVILAAFASGIAGEARQQIEENVSRLAIDLWDRNALKYQHVSPENRGAFLDGAVVEFIRMMEAMGGEPSGKSDSDILAEIRRQTQRDKEAFRAGKGVPPPRALARMIQILDGNVGGHATNAQRARGQVMMQDMMRHFRNGDQKPPG